MYIADVVLQTGGQENGVAVEDSDNSLPDGDHMDDEMLELVNDIENVSLYFTSY